MKSVAFEHLVDALSSLPGVGKKQANKIAYFLINKDQKYIDDFVSRIQLFKNEITFCSSCNNLSVGELCEICSIDSRDKSKLCIVCTPEDLEKIESTNEYVGLYFVLNEEADVKTKKTISKTTIKKIIEVISERSVEEVIIATNWTINGEATASIFREVIREVNPAIQIFRLALGLPINSALDYADITTLKYAIANKTKY